MKNPNVLKIDVEGYELEVLKGGKNLLENSNAPDICIEYSINHPQFGGSSSEVFRFIKDINKYRVYKLKYRREIPSKLVEIHTEQDLPRADNLFCFLNRKKDH